MAYEQKPNRGAMFPNDKKTTDSHPDLKGDFNIDGVNYWISGWTKQGSRGEFISFSVEKKKAPELASSVPDKQPEARQHKAPPQPVQDGFEDSDIPF